MDRMHKEIGEAGLYFMKTYKDMILTVFILPQNFKDIEDYCIDITSIWKYQTESWTFSTLGNMLRMALWFGESSPHRWSYLTKLTNIGYSVVEKSRLSAITTHGKTRWNMVRRVQKFSWIADNFLSGKVKMINWISIKINQQC